MLDRYSSSTIKEIGVVTVCSLVTQVLLLLLSVRRPVAKLRELERTFHDAVFRDICGF